MLQYDEMAQDPLIRLAFDAKNTMHQALGMPLPIKSESRCLESAETLSGRHVPSSV